MREKGPLFTLHFDNDLGCPSCGADLLEGDTGGYVFGALRCEPCWEESGDVLGLMV